MNYNQKKIKQNEKKHDDIASVYNLKHTEIYNDFEQNRLREMISDLLNFIDVNDDISVLDFGSGTGNLALKFLENSCKVTACDLSQKSLNILKDISDKNTYLQIQKLSGTTIPLADNSFHIVAAYSVLHHIPDYLFAVKEMIRVCKKGGLIYIDHEANHNRWNPTAQLSEWYKLSNQTNFEHLLKLIRTKELFTFSFLKTIFYKAFINKRYEREGDIHVWNDDHIEWNKIQNVLNSENCERVKEQDYLLYKPKTAEQYHQFSDKCTDTKYIIYRKK